MPTHTEQVRVRFAPSPTGPLHIGGVRTALYNYLFARHTGGKMILRIEDTDQNRYVPGAENYIIDSLDWTGIRFDEGVHVGGPFAPYRQSDRKEIYRKYADKLIRSGHAYFSFDTAEELEAKRKEAEKSKRVFTYDASVRMGMKNSLSLSQDETRQRLDSGEPYVIRFRIPENETLVFRDLIRGEITVNTATLDDKVLFKSDGMPTYHLANIVDDHLMEISHVIRGEEWLPSLPLHILLYRSFGWETPLFAHLPLILKPEGSGKLSKRDGDRLGFPVFPLEWQDPFTNEKSSGYRESGYFPETVVNMLALLGWNPGTEQEIFTMDELIREFSIDRVGKSGSRFDPDKIRWFNHHYLVNKPVEELTRKFQEILVDKGIRADDAFVGRIVELVRDRSDFVSHFWEQSHFFFQPPRTFDTEIVKKKWKEDTPSLLKAFGELLPVITDFRAENIKALAETFVQEKGTGLGQLMNPLRLCLVGGSFGPDLALICEMLGAGEVVSRIDRALVFMKQQEIIK
ncbi:MAG: glutamate--tRNA ligase [Bacteroidales bacterium]|nr:glutamate--tRNA ligase [Bacteroidales bacterium]